MMEWPLAKEHIISDWYVLTFSAIARTSMIARSSDTTLSTVFAKEIADSTTTTTALLKQVESRLSSAEERDTFAKVLILRKAYQDSKIAVMNARKEGNTVAAEHAYVTGFAPAAKAYGGKVQSLLQIQRNVISKMAGEIQAAHERGTRLAVVLSACSSASSTKSVRIEPLTRQPTLRRARTSMTKAA